MNECDDVNNEVQSDMNSTLRYYKKSYILEYLLSTFYLISSLMPRLARKVFMLFHEVSWIPMSRRTPSRISRMTSGGALKDRISDSASDLIFPTAALASSISGSISTNSASISFFLNV